MYQRYGKNIKEDTKMTTDQPPKKEMTTHIVYTNSGIKYNIMVCRSRDGTLFLSDENNSDGGFIYFYPKMVRELKKFLNKRYKND